MPTLLADYTGGLTRAVPTPAGADVPLDVVRGTVAAANGRLQPAAGSVATYQAGVGGNDATVSMLTGNCNTGGGYAILFRLQDADNYWRLGIRRHSYSVQIGTETFQSGTEQYVVRYESQIIRYDSVFTGRYNRVQVGTQTVLVGYNYTTSWTTRRSSGDAFTGSFQATNTYPTQGYPSPSAGAGDYVATVDYSSSPAYETQPVFEDQPIYESVPVYGDVPIYDTRPVFSTRPVFGTQTDVQLRLDIVVNGALTLVKQAVGLEQTAKLLVAFQAQSITAQAVNSTGGVLATLTQTDPRFVGATRHGPSRIDASLSQGSTDGVDDFTVLPFNEPPGAPTGLLPTALSSTSAVLSAVVVDPEGSAVRASFQVATDAGFTQLVASGVLGGSVASGQRSSTSPVAGLTGRVYFIRAQGIDAQGLAGPFSAAVQLVAGAPAAPTITLPAAAASSTRSAVVIGWTANPTIAGQAQGGYVLQRTSTRFGSQWWNGQAWQGTAVTVLSSAAQVAFPLDAWPVGSYGFTVATVDPFGTVGVASESRSITVGGGLAMVV